MWSTKIIVIRDDQADIDEEVFKEIVRRHKKNLEEDLERIIPQ